MIDMEKKVLNNRPKMVAKEAKEAKVEAVLVALVAWEEASKIFSINFQAKVVVDNTSILTLDKAEVVAKEVVKEAKGDNRKHNIKKCSTKMIW